MARHGGGPSATGCGGAGHDGWLSIEQEDVLLSRREGLVKSIALLNNVNPLELSDFQLQDI